MKSPMIVIAGPTAVGKTKVSIQLASEINGSVISGDSMQVYKKMNIGTAKITKEEMKNIKHYMIDELEPDDEFNVAKFQSMAKKSYEQILEKGKIPIIVGGTGFYIQAITNNIDFTETVVNLSYRQELELIAKTKGNDFLHHMLHEVDEKSAETIHENNVKRVIRALEYYKDTNEKISDHNEREKSKSSPYNLAYFVLNMSRELLYSRVDQRVDIMIEQGLIKEVEKLLNMGYSKNLVSMQGLGYKEIVKYLEGDLSLEESIDILKRDTRHFAKRQLTWFKREKDAIWINVDEFNMDTEMIKNKMIKHLEEKSIII